MVNVYTIILTENIDGRGVEANKIPTGTTKERTIGDAYLNGRKQKGQQRNCNKKHALLNVHNHLFLVKRYLVHY